MKINLENRPDLGASILRQITYMPYQLKEKCREYNVPLCVAFVDYETSFNSVQTQAILTSLQEQGIYDVYIKILKDIYTDSSVTVGLHLHKESEKIRIKR